MPGSSGKVSAGSQWMVCALPKLEASSGAISVMHASRAGPDRWRMCSVGELHRATTDGGLEVLDTRGCKSFFFFFFFFKWGCLWQGAGGAGSHRNLVLVSAALALALALHFILMGPSPPGGASERAQGVGSSRRLCGSYSGDPTSITWELRKMQILGPTSNLWGPREYTFLTGSWGKLMMRF